MRFEYWPVLLLLTLIPILHRWWKERNRPPRVVYPLPISAEASSPNPLKWLLLLRYAGLALLIFSLARPQSSFRQTERKVSGIDILMVMDVSASMMAEDLAERSRLDIAKETMERFVKGRQNDRIGFVTFSGEPLTLAPPTLDYSLVIQQMRNVETGILRDGTAIGDGLAMAVNRLRGSTAKSRIVVLLTDGDNNVGQVGPADAGEMAKGYGIKVYTIAIGKEGRIKIPIRRKGMFGNAVTQYIWQDNALNTELLQLIARVTSGKFYRVQDLETLESVFEEIDSLERTEIQATERTRYEDHFQKPLKLGVLLLIIEQLLARGWWRLLP